jgi:plasmid stabilization system protein ParE
MKKYSAIFHPDAETDITSSYEWGRRIWGDNQANERARELQRSIKSRLTSLPLSCPLALEGDDLGIAVRQLIVHRYRVLIVVEKKAVTILHVRGLYAARLDSREAVQE